MRMMRMGLMGLIGLMTVLMAMGQDTNTVPAPIPVEAPPQATSWLSFLSSGSNFMVAPYGIFSTGPRSVGGGVAVAYKISDYIAPAMRIDYLNSSFYQGSLSAQVQYPIHFGSNITVVPFGLAGAATPFGGAGDNNLTPQGIAGVGAALRLDFLGGVGKRLDLIADWEKWSATRGSQIRLGLLYKF